MPSTAHCHHTPNLPLLVGESRPGGTIRDFNAMKATLQNRPSKRKDDAMSRPAGSMYDSSY